MNYYPTDNLVLGTAGLGGVWGEVDANESILTIERALEHGILTIDTAPAYGDAEIFLGEVLRNWSGERPLINTKVGRLKSYRADEAYYDYTSEGMTKSVENSLKTLGVSVIDVLFLHDPAAIPQVRIEEVLEQMQYFKDCGYAKKIGLGGNAPLWFKPYLTSDVFDVFMEYNKLNAICIDALDTSIPFCQEYRKAYYVASPLHMGLLGNRFSEFAKSSTGWPEVEDIVRATKVNLIAGRNNMSLQMLAHRFLLNIPYDFKIVMGAANLEQFNDTLGALSLGKLPEFIFQEIIQSHKLY